MKRHILLALLLIAPHVIAEDLPQKELIEESPQEAPTAQTNESSNDPIVDHLQEGINQLGLAVREVQGRSKKLVRGILDNIDAQLNIKAELSLSEKDDCFEIKVILPEELTLQEPTVEISDESLFSITFNNGEKTVFLEGSLDRHLFQVELMVCKEGRYERRNHFFSIRGKYQLKNMQANIDQQSHTLTLRIPREDETQSIRRLPINVT